MLLFFSMSLFWPCLLLLITSYLLVVNKYSSEVPESYHSLCVDVVIVVVFIVVIVVVNVIVVVLLGVTDNIILVVVNKCSFGAGKG